MKIAINHMDRSNTAPGHTKKHKDAKELFLEANVGRPVTPSVSAMYRRSRQDDYLTMTMDEDESRGISGRESIESMNLPSELNSPTIESRLIGHNAEKHCSAPAHTREHTEAKEIFTAVHKIRTTTPSVSAPTKSKRHRKVNQVNQEPEPNIITINFPHGESRKYSIYSERTMSTESIDLPSELSSPDWNYRAYIDMLDERSCTAPGHSNDHREAKEIFTSVNVGRPKTPISSAPYRSHKEDEFLQMLLQMEESISRVVSKRSASVESMNLPSELNSPTIDSRLIGFNADRHSTAPSHTRDHTEAKEIFTAVHLRKVRSLSCSAPSKMRKHKMDNQETIQEPNIITINLPTGESRKYSIYSERTMSIESIDLPSELSSPDWNYRAYIDMLDERSVTAPGYSNDHKDAKQDFATINLGKQISPPCSAPIKTHKEDEFLQMLMMQANAESRVASHKSMSVESLNLPSELNSPTIDSRLIGSNADRHGTAPSHSREHKEAKEIFKTIHVGKPELGSCSAPTKTRRHKKVPQTNQMHKLSTSPYDVPRIRSGQSSRTLSAGSIALPSGLNSPDWNYRAYIDVLDERSCSAPGHTYDHKEAKECFKTVNVGKMITPPCSAPCKTHKEDELLKMILLEAQAESRMVSRRSLSVESMKIPSELNSPTIDSRLIGHNADRHGTAPPQTRNHKEAKEAFTAVYVGKPKLMSCSAPSKLRKQKIRANNATHPLPPSLFVPPTVQKQPISKELPKQESFKVPAKTDDQTVEPEVIYQNLQPEPKIISEKITRHSATKESNKISNQINELIKISSIAKATQTSGRIGNSFINCNGITNNCCGSFYPRNSRSRSRVRNSSVCTIS